MKDDLPYYIRKPKKARNSLCIALEFTRQYQSEALILIALLAPPMVNKRRGGHTQL